MGRIWHLGESNVGVAQRAGGIGAGPGLYG
jgi:hypothetical protein